MRAFEGGECRGGANGFITEQEKDADGLGLADDQDEVDLEHRELRHPKRGAFAENDIDVIGLGLAFETGGQIGVVAEHRIVEALIRAEIAGDAFPGVEAGRLRKLSLCIGGVSVPFGLRPPLISERAPFAVNTAKIQQITPKRDLSGRNSTVGASYLF